MRTLANIPGISWSEEDVRREYKKLSARIGMPKYVVTDGASELRESVAALKKGRKKPVLLRDMRHVAANIFERLVGKDERFQLYLSKLGQTRNHVQQTELGHFTPSSQKPKTRFMNLGPSLRWGEDGFVPSELPSLNVAEGNHSHASERQTGLGAKISRRVGGLESASRA